MFASLPMYDQAETRAAHDAFWALIRDGLRARGIAAPDALDRETPHMEGWARPDLVLGQICNLPYRARFRGRLTRIGAADYGLPDCPPGHYRAIWIVRAGDPARRLADCAGYRFAFNEGLSNSGWGAPWLQAGSLDLGLLAAKRTGSHAGSLRAVLEGHADLACLDAITLGLMRRTDAAARAVREVGRTPASPGMTFVTALGLNPWPYFNILAAAIAGLTPADRAVLGLRGLVALPDRAYDLPLPPEPPELPE